MAGPATNDRDDRRQGRRPRQAVRPKQAARKGSQSGASKRPTGARQARPSRRQSRATLAGGFVGTDVDFANGRMVLKNADLLQELATFFGETDATHSALIRLSLSGGVQQPDNGATVDARC